MERNNFLYKIKIKIKINMRNMNKNLKMMRILFFMTFCIISLNGYSQFSINAEIRPRYEFRDGYKTLSDETRHSANIVNQRSRLNLESKSENLNFRISIQDIRTWGESSVKSDVASTFLNEAWAELNLNANMSLKLGRQILKYDDQRILSATNWNNVGTSHDLVLLKIEKESFKTHIGFAYNNDKEKNFESFYPVKYYKTLNYIWLYKKFNDNFEVSLIDVLDGNQKDSSDYVIYGRNTIGSNVLYKMKNIGLNISGNFYYQSGKDLTGKDIQAYFYSAKLVKKFGNKLSGILGIDYYSGSDGLDTTNTKINTFNKLYGAGHKYAGSMDYFTNTYSQTKNGGLSDIFLGIKYTLNEKLYFDGSIHYLSLANNVIDPNYTGADLRALDKNLGTEIDLSFAYSLTKEVKFNFGYSMMLATESMEVIKGGDSEKIANWAFIMITIKPKLFSN